jgi:hypothetical protein
VDDTNPVIRKTMAVLVRACRNSVERIEWGVIVARLVCSTPCLPIHYLNVQERVRTILA